MVKKLVASIFGI